MNVDSVLEKAQIIAKSYSSAIELYEFYKESELVKLSVSIAEKFHQYAQTPDEHTKKHIKLDINDSISCYKNALQKIGIDSSEFAW